MAVLVGGEVVMGAVELREADRRSKEAGLVPSTATVNDIARLKKKAEGPKP